MDYPSLTEDELEFGIAINDEDTGEYVPRISNMGKIQRKKITGFDRREPMVVYGRRDDTIHGTNSEGDPCSLIVFCWYLHERERGRRFRSLRITVSFASSPPKDSGAARDSFYDPHVLAVAPHGTYGLLPTITAIEKKTSVEATLEAGFEGVKVGGKIGYELTQAGDHTHIITVNGMPCSYYERGEQPGDPDRCNAVEWNLFENDARKNGLPTFFRTAVLLERRSGDSHKFTASFEVRSEVDTITDAKTRIKKAFGLIPRDDAVIFDPKVTETSRLDGYVDELDTAPLDEECKFVMYKEPDEA